MTPQNLIQDLMEKGWKQIEISRAIGLSQPNISRIASGTQECSWKHMVSLMNLVGKLPDREKKKQMNDPTTYQHTWNQGMIAGIAFACNELKMPPGTYEHLLIRWGEELKKPLGKINQRSKDEQPQGDQSAIEADPS